MKGRAPVKSLKDATTVDARRRVRVGVDTGGTFTDFVCRTTRGTLVFKLPSTPDDPSRAIVEGLKRVASETGARATEIEVVHGTTVGTNALLERKGARVALVTTEGFEDVLEIGRQARGRLYDLNWSRNAPLVVERLRLGVRERIASDGTTLVALDDEEIARLINRLRRAKAEAIAVSLIFSFARPHHERMIEDALAAALPGVPLSISHRILPEYREFERTSTVAVNAYLQPLMGSYLGRLSSRVGAGRLSVMQSSGGSISARVASAEPVRTILSGPAGGVVGAARASRRSGLANIITFDMGGTSTDVALGADGEVRLTNESIVAGLPVAVPVLDIHTVGAGGGSIARVDAGGSLRVGPQSAGANPGPACYGRSDTPTVTDANLILGRFGGADLLGGDFPLDEERARRALRHLAADMSKSAGREVSLIEAALGVVRVVNAGMERALRAVSVERGHDPRDFALVTFGGAGGLHAVELAQALRIPRVLVPGDPGALSADGALRSDVLKTTSRTVMLDEADADCVARLEKVFGELERETRAALGREGFAPQRQRHVRSIAARYRGQSFELQIEWNGGRSIAARFSREHERRYGYAQADGQVEIVSARLRSVGLIEQPRTRRTKALIGQSRPRPHSTSLVHFDERPNEVAIYRREELSAGARLVSPCIVTEYSSTTLVPRFAHAHVDEELNLLIELSNQLARRHELSADAIND